MTKALILAAGQGTRLRPLTNNLPKCLVPLLGRSILERQIETLNSEGINDVHIVTGYCAEKIQALGFDTTFNERFESTNMVASFFSAINFLKSFKEDLIVGYGDIVYQQNNLKALLASNDDMSLMVDKEWRSLWSLRLENPLEDAETLVLDDDDYVLELGKKPVDYKRIHGQYTGLIKIRAEKIAAIIDFYENLDRNDLYDGQDFDNMYMTSFIQLMINSGWGVKSVPVKNGWLEIDSVDDLNLYENLYKDNKLNSLYDYRN